MTHVTAKLHKMQCLFPISSSGGRPFIDLFVNFFGIFYKFAVMWQAVETTNVKTPTNFKTF